MSKLLYKEFMLAKHPTMFIFPFLGALLLIPAYPYFVAFIYTCLTVFFIFLMGRVNKDVYFSVSLPVCKRDIVKARCVMIALIEVFQIICAIPFAVIGIKINPNSGGNIVGMEANTVFFGLVLIMYAIFNIIFIPIFYKTAFKSGIALIFASIAITVYIFAVELAVQLIPALKASLDIPNPDLSIQWSALAAGIIIFIAAIFLAYKKAADNFEKVDL